MLPTPPMYMPGTLADGLEPFEDGDVFRGISGRHSVQLVVYQDVSTQRRDDESEKRHAGPASADAYNTRMGRRRWLNRIAVAVLLVAVCTAA